MNIINNSLHVIDVESNALSEISVASTNEDLRTYLTELLSKIIGAEGRRKFQFQRDTTEVKSAIDRILSGSNFSESSLVSAQRLLEKEVSVQESIEHLRYEIQKGVLVQALVEIENTRQFVIAKADHSNYLDDEQYRTRRGLPIKKKIYKAFLAQFDRSNRITNMYVYDTNPGLAKYWWSDYLELVEVNTDEHNTDKAFDSIDKNIFSKIKEEFRADHNILRNRVLGFFRSERVFDIDTFIENTIGEYEPIDENLNVADLKRKIRDLPAKRGFDSQFNIKVEVIKAKRLKNIVPINEKIDLHIKDHIDDIGQIITAYKHHGEKFIKIKTDTGYDAFIN
jgi:hypothetical protein